MSGAVEGVALLPCPFCGSEQITTAPDMRIGHPWWAAVCKACGVSNTRETEADAIAAWNTRTTPPARSYADAIEEAAKVADDLAKTAASLQAALELHGVDAPIKNAQRETATTLAAAIRLLSQGGKA